MNILNNLNLINIIYVNKIFYCVIMYVFILDLIYNLLILRIFMQVKNYISIKAKMISILQKWLNKRFLVQKQERWS